MRFLQSLVRRPNQFSSLLGARSRALLHSSSKRAIAGIKVEFDGVDQAHVKDTRVNVTFVDYAGKRVRLPGRVGQTLTELAADHKLDMVENPCSGGGTPDALYHKKQDFWEPKYGVGPMCHGCHVIIPQDKWQSMPALTDTEKERLDDYPFPEDLAVTSRLGCQVKLTKEMDGMVCYVPDNPVYESF